MQPEEFVPSRWFTLQLTFLFFIPLAAGIALEWREQSWKKYQSTLREASERGEKRN
jgi:hypothetical protein